MIGEAHDQRSRPGRHHCPPAMRRSRARSARSGPATVRGFSAPDARMGECHANGKTYREASACRRDVPARGGLDGRAISRVYRSRQIAARSQFLLLSHTAPTIQPMLLMSMARPLFPPLGTGSISMPPLTGHLAGRSRERPTTSPLLCTAFPQALSSECPPTFGFSSLSVDATRHPPEPSGSSVHRTACSA